MVLSSKTGKVHSAKVLGVYCPPCKGSRSGRITSAPILGLEEGGAELQVQGRKWG